MFILLCILFCKIYFYTSLSCQITVGVWNRVSAKLFWIIHRSIYSCCLTGFWNLFILAVIRWDRCTGWAWCSVAYSVFCTLGDSFPSCNLVSFVATRMGILRSCLAPCMPGYTGISPWGGSLKGILVCWHCFSPGVCLNRRFPPSLLCLRCAGCTRGVCEGLAHRASWTGMGNRESSVVTSGRMPENI